MNDRPVLRRQNAPDHGPDFWDELDAAMAAPESQTSTMQTSTIPAHVATLEVSDDERRAPSRSLWPLVAAAAVLALAGLGMLFVRGGSDPGTEVVSGSDASDLALADAPAAGDEGSEPSSETTVPPIPTAVPTPSPADVETAADNTSVEPAPDPVDLDDLDVPTYVTAAGNRDSLMFPPAAPFPDGTRFLATWESQNLSWFSLADIDADCNESDHSTLRFVTSGGFDLDVADPSVRFAGNASNFTHSEQHVAWVTECEGQLVLFVASHGNRPGELAGTRIAWVGRGSDTSALVSWTGTSVQLSSIDNAGDPFFVTVDMVSEVVSGSGARSDVGPGTGRDSWIVGATTGASTTWWNTTPVADATSCDGRTLSRHTDAAGWESAFVDQVDVGEVQALALNAELSMVAFADACPGINQGRFFIGTLRADGLISSVRTIDLSAFASGSVAVLDWTDPVTLRIHTDESVTSGDPLRFEYVFDDGRDAGVLVLLD